MRFISLIIFFLFFQNLFGQLDTERVPYSMHENQVEAWNWIKLPAQDWAEKKKELLKQDRSAPKPFQFGHTFNRTYDLTDGQWRTLANGDKVWTLALHSPSAVSMNVVWSDFYIPKGGALFIYNADKSEIIGAYTHHQNNKDRTLSSWLIRGDKLIIEYNQPAGLQALPALTIGKVVHGLLGPAGSEKDLNDSGDCNHDVKCSIGSEIDGLKDHLSRAAGILLVNGNSFCSSCLINNTVQDETPYILTADHCMGRDPSSIAVRFGWIAENPDCGTETPSENGPEFMVMSGTELLASNPNSDVALLRLNNPIPTEWERVYAGWDRSGAAPEFTFGIHHPSGDIMKVCRDNDPPTKAINAGAETWEILESGGGWEIGVTEPGSSGSPLFDQNGHIVGQLFGGTAACDGTNDNDEYDYYGRFDVSWDAGADAQTRLKDWLDPLQSQVETLSSFPSFDIPDRDLSLEILVNADPPSSLCDEVEEVDISVRVRNRGREPFDSVLVVWSLDALNFDSIFYNTIIDSGQTVLLVDSVVPFVDSTTLMATLTYTDGEIDSIPENNQDTITFTSPFPVVPTVSIDTLILAIRTDRYPRETTWEVVNESGDVLITGGPYVDQSTLYEEKIAIENAGCFTLNVFDSASDGMCCLYGEGNFVLFSPDGDTLALGAEFTNVASLNFKAQSIGFDAALEIKAQPAEGQFCYDLETLDVEVQAKNLGDSTLRNMSIMWSIDGQVVDTVIINEMLAGDSAFVTRTEMPVSSDFQAEIIEFDEDEVEDNNTATYLHGEVFLGDSLEGDILVVEVLTDNYPEETRWELLDLSGQVQASNLVYDQASTLYLDTILLDPNECYEFIIYDEDCNGIFGPGKYTLLNIAGDVMTSGRAFQCSETVSFHSAPLVSSLPEVQSKEFTLFPNPAAHFARIKPVNKVQEVSVYNLHGQLVRETTSAEMDVSFLPSGVYFLHVTSVDGSQEVLKLIKQ